MIHWEHWKHQQVLGFFSHSIIFPVIRNAKDLEEAKIDSLASPIFIARFRIECGDEECGFTMFDDKTGRRVVFKCDCA